MMSVSENLARTALDVYKDYGYDSDATWRVGRKEWVDLMEARLRVQELVNREVLSGYPEGSLEWGAVSIVQRLKPHMAGIFIKILKKGGRKEKSWADMAPDHARRLKSEIADVLLDLETDSRYAEVRSSPEYGEILGLLMDVVSARGHKAIKKIDKKCLKLSYKLYHQKLPTLLLQFGDFATNPKGKKKKLVEPEMYLGKPAQNEWIGKMGDAIDDQLREVYKSRGFKTTKKEPMVFENYMEVSAWGELVSPTGFSFEHGGYALVLDMYKSMPVVERVVARSGEIARSPEQLVKCLTWVNMIHERGHDGEHKGINQKHEELATDVPGLLKMLEVVEEENDFMGIDMETLLQVYVGEMAYQAQFKTGGITNVDGYVVSANAILNALTLSGVVGVNEGRITFDLERVGVLKKILKPAAKGILSGKNRGLELVIHKLKSGARDVMRALELTN